jgi:hypothetical protein
MQCERVSFYNSVGISISFDLWYALLIRKVPSTPSLSQESYLIERTLKQITIVFTSKSMSNIFKTKRVTINYMTQ